MNCTPAFEFGFAIALVFGVTFGTIFGMALEDGFDILKMWDKKRGGK